MPLVPVLAQFDLTDLPDIISKTNKRFANNEARSFRRTVANWSLPHPEFKVIGEMVGFGVIDYKVFTTSEKYHWVNDGTDPHVIKPRGDYPLRFQSGYSPKTRANKIESVGSGQKFGEYISTYSVVQSIEARDFTGQIKDKATDRWSRALETELTKYTRRKVK